MISQDSSWPGFGKSLKLCRALAPDEKEYKGAVVHFRIEGHRFSQWIRRVGRSGFKRR